MNYISPIEIFPTYIKIPDYEPGEYSSLEKNLSVWDKASFRYSFHAFKYDDEEMALYIPSGVDITQIKEFYKGREVIDRRKEYFDIKRENKKIKLFMKPKDDIQLEALKFLMDAKYSDFDYQKLLCLGTGMGKTYCAVNYIITSKRIPMIFVNRNSLAEQWEEKILEYTDTKKEEIFHISGTQSINKLLKMKATDIKKIKFYIAMHKTVSKYIDNNEHGALDKLFNKLGISVKIFDEAHLEWDSMLKIDYETNCKTIYLTATPSRSNPLEDRVYNTIFRKVIKLTKQSKTIKNKVEIYHNVIIAKYKTNPSDEFVIEFMKKSRARGFNVNLYCDYINNERYQEFYRPLKNFLEKAVYSPSINYKRKTLILVKRIQLIERLYEDLNADLGEKLNLNIAVKYSNPKADLNQDLDNADLILSTESSMGTGQDISNLEMVISTIPTSSATLTTQLLGRIRNIPDRNVFFVDYVDISFDKSVSQLKARVGKVYKKSAKSIREINL